MNILRSFTETVVTTPTNTFPISFEYDEKYDAVHVFLNDVAVEDLGYTVSQVNAVTLKVEPAIPEGTVRIERETDIDKMKYIFDAGALFIDQNVDADFKQIVHAQQEVRDGFIKLRGDVLPLVHGLQEALQQAQEASEAAQEAADAAEEAAQVSRSAANVFDSSGLNQQQINDIWKGSTLDLGYFKTDTNTDTDAMLAMLAYAKANNIKHLTISKDTTLSQKIRCEQNAAGWLNDLTIDFKGHNIHYTGLGADSLTTGIFEIVGSLDTVTTTVVGDHAEYTSSVTVASSAGFSVGDYILIKGSNVRPDQLYLNHVVRIESISGNVLSTDTIRRLPLLPSIGPVSVTKINRVDNFQLLGKPLVTADNQTERSKGIGALIAMYCTNCTFHIQSKGLWFKTVSTYFCSRLRVDADGFDAAAVGGGEGYTVQLSYTTHSIVKAQGHNMRHTIDLTAAWHNVCYDSTDNKAATASYSTHRAYEYNNIFLRCHSFDAKVLAFGFGPNMFGDHTDRTYILQCTAIGFEGDGAVFSNKGSGLYIQDSYFKGTGYSLITADNDTFAINTELASGTQVVSGADINTAGRCVLINSVTKFAPNKRAVSMGTGTTLELINSRTEGQMSLSADATLRGYNAHIQVPVGTNLCGATTANLILIGGKFDIPSTATTSQTNSFKKLHLNGVEFVQTNPSIVNALYGADTTYLNCFGSSRLTINGTNINRLTMSGNVLSNVGATTLLSLISFPSTSRVRLSNNTLIGSGAALVINDTNSLSKLQILGNTITGITSIVNAAIISCIIKDNVLDGTTTLPSASTSKIIADNLI